MSRYLVPPKRAATILPSDNPGIPRVDFRISKDGRIEGANVWAADLLAEYKEQDCDTMNHLGPTKYTTDTLADIGCERSRQESMKAAGRFTHTPFDSEMRNAERLAVLVEEVGEVARALLERAKLSNDGKHDRAALRKELIQVAAVACAWAERLTENPDSL